jgi:hypothetical protein
VLLGRAGLCTVFPSKVGRFAMPDSLTPSVRLPARDTFTVAHAVVQTTSIYCAGRATAHAGSCGALLC